jgi:7-keto-8-aminopelargonate synthetase-like enzyme
VVLGRYPLHERMVVVLGLAKGFGASGAVIVCPNSEWADRIFSFGGGLVFSGPMQPAQLGAGIAAAKILLSDELPTLQSEVRARIELFDSLCRESGIAMPQVPVSPIRFIPVGEETGAIGLCQNLQELGCFTNLSMYPAVPRGRAGVRVVFTRHLALADVQYLARNVARELEAPRQSSPELIVSAPQVAA